MLEPKLTSPNDAAFPFSSFILRWRLLIFTSFSAAIRVFCSSDKRVRSVVSVLQVWCQIKDCNLVRSWTTLTTTVGSILLASEQALDARPSGGACDAHRSPSVAMWEASQQRPRPALRRLGWAGEAQNTAGERTPRRHERPRTRYYK
eukprot:scaffold20075_cov109-Isochrysis_galbana.AAC.1